MKCYLFYFHRQKNICILEIIILNNQIFKTEAWGYLIPKTIQSESFDIIVLPQEVDVVGSKWFHHALPLPPKRQEHKNERDLHDYEHFSIYRYIIPENTIPNLLFYQQNSTFRTETNRPPNPFSPCTFGKTHLRLPEPLRTFYL